MEISRIIDIESVDKINFSRSNWTAIIPAAGHGTRLGYSRPKILYPIFGKLILDWLINSLKTVCSNYVFVLSPHGLKDVEREIKARLGNAYEIAIQDTPTGMGDAVLLAEEKVTTLNTIVVWGDQVTLRSHTLRVCASIHEARKNARLTFPTIIRKEPYIHIERDNMDRIIGVGQAREGDIVSICSKGENDCGVFLFTNQMLFSTLKDAKQHGIGVGKITQEFNMLPVLPNFEKNDGSVRTVRITDQSETLGINTTDDVRLAEIELEKRSLEK